VSDQPKRPLLGAQRERVIQLNPSTIADGFAIVAMAAVTGLLARRAWRAWHPPLNVRLSALRDEGAQLLRMNPDSDATPEETIAIILACDEKMWATIEDYDYQGVKEAPYLVVSNTFDEVADAAVGVGVRVQLQVCWLTRQDLFRRLI
jgi:hypothetical protein